MQYANYDSYVELNFTFQSGYIQIEPIENAIVVTLDFTFQSGYIQIRQQVVFSATYNPLHSNLVIFK